MNRQRRGSRPAIWIAVVALACALMACTDTVKVSPSTYSGDPDSQALTLQIQAAAGDTVAAVEVTEETDEQVVIEVLIDESSRDSEDAATLEAVVELDRVLGTREVVDTEGRAIPQA
ncbi:hypothetical protein [Tessaracoccus sp. ZS01]|uniref:hypothetical protein n=1 Tax=Tessaracoccus sp. ZS01 TaxID=1906324 RepID=UPI00117CFAC4|nr:hypothetical protein [Tessaracoccus sp. ZS01]